MEFKAQSKSASVVVRDYEHKKAVDVTLTVNNLAQRLDGYCDRDGQWSILFGSVSDGLVNIIMSTEQLERIVAAYNAREE